MLKPGKWGGNVRELKKPGHKVLAASAGYPNTTALIRKALDQTSFLRADAPRPARPVEPEPTLAGQVSQLLSAAQRGEATDIQERLRSWAESEIYRQALRIAEGDLDQAASSLGVSRSTV